MPILQLQKVPLDSDSQTKPNFLTFEDLQQIKEKQEIVKEKQVEELTRLISEQLVNELATDRLFQNSIQLDYDGPQIDLLREKGILCTIDSVKEYSQDLGDIIIQDQYKTDLIKRMNTPIGIGPLEKLKIIQQNILNDIEQSSQLETSLPFINQLISESVLNDDIFKIMEDKFIDEIIKELEEEPEDIKEKILELQRIHNSAVFAAFNEALDNYRPWGLRQRPLPWKVNINKIKINQCNTENYNQIIEKVKDKVLEWTSNLCGFIHDKEESLFFIDDDYLTQIREDRMARMLAQEVLIYLLFKFYRYLRERNNGQIMMMKKLKYKLKYLTYYLRIQFIKQQSL